jgi:hypothetical protein
MFGLHEGSWPSCNWCTGWLMITSTGDNSLILSWFFSLLTHQYELNSLFFKIRHSVTTLIDGTLHCCMFRFWRNHHQTIHSGHLNHISPSADVVYMTCTNCFVDDPFGIETCSKAECRLWSAVLSEWRILFYFYANIVTQRSSQST